MKRFFLVFTAIFFLIPFLYGCNNAKIYWLTEKAKEAHDDGNNQKAIELYKKVIELEPNNPNNYWELGIAYLDSGEEEKANEVIAQLRKLGHDDYADKMEELIRKSKSPIIRRKVEDKELKYIDYQ